MATAAGVMIVTMTGAWVQCPSQAAENVIIGRRGSGLEVATAATGPGFKLDTDEPATSFPVFNNLNTLWLRGRAGSIVQLYWSSP